MQSSYFGHDEFAKYAPCLKTITDAETIRSKILSAYELAESTDDADERRRQMTFVLVGAGPTGVELAASLAQMATTTLRRNFRRIDPADNNNNPARRRQADSSEFCEIAVEKSREHLAKLGVQVITGSMVEQIDARGVTVGGKLIPCGYRIVDRGRFAVAPGENARRRDRPCRSSLRRPVLECSEILRGVFVVGDTATLMQNGKPCRAWRRSQSSRATMSDGLFLESSAAENRRARFATSIRAIWRSSARISPIMESGRIRLAGFTAWLAWAFIHLMFLPQLQNRRRVRNQWLWSYFTGQRSSRLVSEPPRTV